ncbi:MAG: Por secretion system protein, partial [Crocinitomicaceae bacterium]|nr:Por secretion system protein [Crocinitomicaceae bacterium]
MKRLLLLSILTSLVSCNLYVLIPDQNFEQALIDLGYDDVVNGKLLTANIINVDSLDVFEKGISDLKGIEAFTSLKSLDCGGN